MVTMFIDTLPSPFYDKAVGSVASGFANLVTVGERIKSSIKWGKFVQANNNIGFAKKISQEKKKGEANAILLNPATYNQSKGKNNNLIPMTYMTFLPLLLRSNLIAISSLKSMEPPYLKSYDLNEKCNSHGGAIGHPIEKCWELKHKVQDLIDGGWLGFRENEPNVNSNPHPSHGGQSNNATSHEYLE
ncbi:hypothetical protein CR513_43138, partial [Mucuna pruriens]